MRRALIARRAAAAALGAVLLVALTACSSSPAPPSASSPSAPGGSGLGSTTPPPATGTRPVDGPSTGTTPSTVPERGTTPPPVPGPPQPWGEGGATVVELARVGFPSYTIGSIAADNAGGLWFDAGATTQRCLARLDPRSGDLTADARAVGQVATGRDGSLWWSLDQSVVRQQAGVDGAGAAYDVGATVGSELVVHPLTVDPQGRAWVTLTGANAIARVDRGGPVTRVTDGIPTGANPGTIDAGDDGTVWFAEPDVHMIGRATPDGVVTQVDVGGAPEIVVAATGGGAWFYDTDDRSFGRIDGSGAVQRLENATPSAPVIDMTVAPDGSVWYVADPGIVGRFGDGLPLQEIPIADTSGTTTRASFHHPKAITADDAGMIWFTDLFYPGEGSTIAVFAAFAGAPPPDWPQDLPLDRSIGSTLTTCGDG